MIGDVFNLLAAILCTLGSFIGTIAIILMGPTFDNHLAALASAIATIGGIAWVAAAAIGLRERGK